MTAIHFRAIKRHPHHIEIAAGPIRCRLHVNWLRTRDHTRRGQQAAANRANIYRDGLS